MERARRKKMKRTHNHRSHRSSFKSSLFLIWSFSSSKNALLQSPFKILRTISQHRQNHHLYNKVFTRAVQYVITTHKKLENTHNRKMRNTSSKLDKNNYSKAHGKAKKLQQIKCQKFPSLFLTLAFSVDTDRRPMCTLCWQKLGPDQELCLLYSKVISIWNSTIFLNVVSNMFASILHILSLTSCSLLLSRTGANLSFLFNRRRVWNWICGY